MANSNQQRREKEVRLVKSLVVFLRLIIFSKFPLIQSVAILFKDSIKFVLFLCILHREDKTNFLNISLNFHQLFPNYVSVSYLFYFIIIRSSQFIFFRDKEIQKYILKISLQCFKLSKWFNAYVKSTDVDRQCKEVVFIQEGLFLDS